MSAALAALLASALTSLTWIVALKLWRQGELNAQSPATEEDLERIEGVCLEGPTVRRWPDGQNQAF